MKRKYRGLKRNRCPHSHLTGIYGDAINFFKARLYCYDCGRYLDGSPKLAEMREKEQEL